LARLLYETSDRAFAHRAIGALEGAKIDCYEVGPEYDTTYVPRGEIQVCIYVVNDADYARANSVLIGLGAAVDEPVRLPPLWVLICAAALLVALTVWVSLEWT
jgi:hypothetical protein